MLLILAVLYFFNNINAVPISYVLRDAEPPDFRSTLSQCACPNQQRSLWDILWSCLATIFACTWVSVHPNIPPSGEKWWKTGLRRVELMFWALIAPEMIIYWAMSQWYGARAIVEKYQGHGWTKAHAYFIQMGGFTVFERGKPQRVLLPDEMEDLLREGRINLPQITEEEIRDRSKGDGLSKTLVIGQTSWFVAQCIARRAQGLILTELELATGAFAVLNGVMYFLWWNKPLDVRCPVPVHLLDELNKGHFEFKSTEKSVITLRGAIFSLISAIHRRSISILATSITWAPKMVKSINLTVIQNTVIRIFTFPWNATLVFYSRLVDIGNFEGSDNMLEVAGSVPTVSAFYASNKYTTTMIDQLLVPSFTSAIAALFGGLHCVGWFFSFPSHAELIIWRVSSTVIAMIPMGMLFGFITAFFSERGGSKSKLFDMLAKAFYFSVYFLPIYAIGRLLLLGEAFAALRYLPPEALAVVDWLSFLPHI